VPHGYEHPSTFDCELARTGYFEIDEDPGVFSGAEQYAIELACDDETSFPSVTTFAKEAGPITLDPSEEILNDPDEDTKILCLTDNVGTTLEITPIDAISNPELLIVPETTFTDDGALFSLDEDGCLIAPAELVDGDYNIGLNAFNDGGFNVGPRRQQVKINRVKPFFARPFKAFVFEKQTGTGTTVQAQSTPLANGVTLSLPVGVKDNNLFSINPGTGVVTFIAAPTYDPNNVFIFNFKRWNIYRIDAKAVDDVTAEEKIRTYEIYVHKVAALNPAGAPILPSFLTTNDYCIPEHTTAIGFVIAAPLDDFGIPLLEKMRYELNGGADVAHFSIDADTGEFIFTIDTEFDTPVDAGADNIYNVTVKAIVISTGAEANHNITVEVTEVAAEEGETGAAPLLTANDTYYPNENQDTAGIVSATGDAPITFHITGGPDMGLFEFADPSVGTITFKETPDFENPKSSTNSNVYDITILARNANGDSESRQILILVGDVDETTDDDTDIPVTITPDLTDTPPGDTGPGTGITAEDPLGNTNDTETGTEETFEVDEGETEVGEIEVDDPCEEVEIA